MQDMPQTWITAFHLPEAKAAFGNALTRDFPNLTVIDIGSVVREYELHVQPMQYLALYMASKRGEKRFGPVGGVVLDVTQKNYEGKKPKFARVFIEIRKAAVEAFVDSAAFYSAMASRIEWDTPVMRTYQCTYMAGRAKVDCTYKDLCRYGKAGASKFVLRDGTPLRSHKPEPGKGSMPWE